MRYDIHHIHKRKRVHQKLEKYPSQIKWIRVLDRLLLIFACLGPISAIPQIIKIFSLRTAVSLSLISYSLWAIGDIPWIIYGYVHKERPIVIAYSLWMVMNIIIIIGILIYG